MRSDEQNIAGRDAGLTNLAKLANGECGMPSSMHADSPEVQAHRSALWSALQTLGISGLVLATVVVMTASWWTPRVSEPLDPATINADSGYAFTASLRLDPAFPFRIETDHVGAPYASTLTLSEDGRLLGPAHMPHDVIRAKGEGRYSHWAGRLWFSSSDGSDPRWNARSYHIEAKTALSPFIAYSVYAADLACLLWLRRLLAAVRRRHRLYLGVAAAGAVGIAALTSSGTFGVVGPRIAAPKDTALVFDIVRHALIGSLLMLMQWAIGAGLARLILGRDASYARLVLIGFPLSLGAIAVLAALALTIPYGRLLAGTLAVAAVAPLIAWQRDRAALASLKHALPGFCVLSACFGCWLALHWHGPTATLAGFPTGDLVFYASSVWALAAQPIGWPNLGNEGESYDYTNTLFPALGAALLPALKLDGFLFIIASGGTIGLLGAALALHAYLTTRPPLHWPSWPAAFVVMSFLAAGYYPSWLVESPPVLAVTPLCIAVWFLIGEGKNRPSAPLAAFVVATVGTALSKLVAAATLGPLALAGLLPHLRNIPTPGKIGCLAVLALGSAYCGLALAHYLPIFLDIAPIKPQSYELIVDYGVPLSSAWPFLARDLATPLLVLLAFRLAPWPLALALSFGCLLALMFPFLMRVNLMCAVIVIGLLAIDKPQRLEKARWHALAAVLLTGAPMLLRDPTGLATGVVWAVVGAGLCGLAFAATAAETESSAARALRLAFGPLAAIIAALVLIGVARGNVRLSPELFRGPAELTPQVRDIWAAVRDQTPPDALIFTDQTGREPTLLGGWNTYALHGARQVFIANFYMSLVLRNNATEREARLAANEDVLSGRRAPSSLDLRGSYGSYFAVVSARRPMPRNWQRLYANADWALYQWRSEL